MTLYYLAYGSNLHPIRLTERIPSTKFVGVSLLDGYQLHFHKHGTDDSGKCNILNTNNSSHNVYSAIYAIDKEHKSLLDEFEGPGYVSKEIHVICDEKKLRCFAYFANDSHINDSVEPYHWYKEIVQLGAEYHGFPQDYISHILTFNSKHDPDHTRRDKHENLITKIISHSKDQK